MLFIILISIVWFLIGFSVVIFHSVKKFKVITLSDLVVALMGGLLGPLVFFAIWPFRDFDTIILWEKKNDN